MTNRFKKRQKLTWSQKTIITVIVVAMLTIIVSAICAVVFRPENQIKSQISNLASNYYEEFLYENLINSENFSGNLEKTLQKYQEQGFATVSLRQLILHQQKTPDSYSYLEEVCDANNTTIKYYPEPAYGRTNYRMNITYSCEW